MADFAKGVLRDLALRPLKSLPGIPSRFPTFNHLTAGGYEPGHLVVVAARTGIGKTTYALAEALHLAQWGRVLYFSLEMNGLELARRVLSSMTGVANRVIKTNALDGAERTRILQATSDSRIGKVWVEDCSSATPSFVRSRIADHMGREGLPPVVAVVLDHAHLMAADGLRAAATPTEVVAQVAHACKGIAKEWNLPVVLLAQLNREAERRGGDEMPEPQLSDLRQSGALEEDANLVVLLHRQRSNTSSLEVILAKARDGEVGRFQVRLNLARNEMTEQAPTAAAA